MIQPSWPGEVIAGQAPFRVEPVQPLWATVPCAPRLPLPPLDARLAPTVSGDVRIVDLRGDTRLCIPFDGILDVQWISASNDAYVVTAEVDGTIGLWRHGDAALIDLVVCPGGLLGARTMALSPDQRWIVVSGSRLSGQGADDVTCIIDRQAHTARVVAGDIAWTGEAMRLTDPSAVQPRPWIRRGVRDPRLRLRLELYGAVGAGGLVAKPQRGVVARSPDGTAIATIDPQGRLALERDGRCVDLGVDLARGHRAAFSPDGNLLSATGSRTLGDGSHMNFGVWHSDSGAPVSMLATEYEYWADFLAGATQVALGPVGGEEGLVGTSVHIVDALRGTEVRTLRLPYTRMRAPDPTGTRWLIDRGGSITLWSTEEPQDGHVIRTFDAARFVYPAVHSPDGLRVAAAFGDGELALWSRDGRSLPIATRHDGPVDLFAFSPDGRWLASAGKDAIRVTDLAAGAEVATVALTADRATLLWWSPRSDRLVIDTSRRFEITVAPISR